jgi:hypothetical protein
MNRCPLCNPLVALQELSTKTGNSEGGGKKVSVFDETEYLVGLSAVPVNFMK